MPKPTAIHFPFPKPKRGNLQAVTGDQQLLDQLGDLNCCESLSGDRDVPAPVKPVFWEGVNYVVVAAGHGPSPRGCFEVELIPVIAADAASSIHAQNLDKYPDEFRRDHYLGRLVKGKGLGKDAALSTSEVCIKIRLESNESLLADSRQPDSYLDVVSEALKGSGSLPSERILMEVYGDPFPDLEAIQALDQRLAQDPRFSRAENGWDLEGLPPVKSIGEMMVDATQGGIVENGAIKIPKESPEQLQKMVDVSVKIVESETIRKLRAQLRDLKSELAAHKDREAEGKALADDITKASGAVEAAKEVLAGKKRRWQPRMKSCFCSRVATRK